MVPVISQRQLGSLADTMMSCHYCSVVMLAVVSHFFTCDPHIIVVGCVVGSWFNTEQCRDTWWQASVRRGGVGVSSCSPDCLIHYHQHKD